MKQYEVSSSFGKVILLGDIYHGGSGAFHQDGYSIRSQSWSAPGLNRRPPVWSDRPSGGVSILAGYKARYGAWLIVLFLVPVTVMMHNFWTITDPMAKSMQQIMFMKNLSMLGAAMFIAYLGSGPLSVDNKG
jgi:hypothetical protein